MSSLAVAWKAKANTRIGWVFRLFAQGRSDYSAVASQDPKTFIVATKSLSEDRFVSSDYRCELTVGVKRNLGEIHKSTTIKKIQEYRLNDAMNSEHGEYG
ncbi:MAG: hypothetical protein MUE50_24850 [Pirellulaceae bacterium]|nr:hypothetical protein [Pirellulaceae bacterium]